MSAILTKRPFAHGWLIQIVQGERVGIECVFTRPEDEGRAVKSAWAAWLIQSSMILLKS